LFAGKKTDKHPLRGVIANGPYSLKFGAPSQVRFALLAPKPHLRKLTALVEELKKPASPREAKNYYPTYPGFEALLRTPISDLDVRLQLTFPDELDEHVKRNDKHALAQGLFQCIAQFKATRSSFDCVLIYLPQSWEACFEGEGFDLHHYVKAYCALEYPDSDHPAIQPGPRLPRQCDVGPECRPVRESGRDTVETHGDQP
jgi:hypothetical protein